jgi:hypothetical protein
MDEKELETRLCTILRDGMANRRALDTLKLTNASVRGHMSVASLLGTADFQVLQDTNDWNQHLSLSLDLFGQLVPDIVVRTQVGGPANYANRIIIEVKYATGLRKPYEASQVVRYFLHLLVTTTKGNPQKDGARSLILAAPASWFTDARNSAAWNYFRRTYGDLPEVFDITLAELHLDALI